MVVLAGDTQPGLRGVEWAARAFGGRPVVYVLGNHEFYGNTAPDLISKAQARGAELGVHVLSDSGVVVSGVRFLGATLWTDFRLFGSSPTAAALAQQRMTDFRKIRVTPHYRKLRRRTNHCPRRSPELLRAQAMQQRNAVADLPTPEHYQIPSTHTYSHLLAPLSTLSYFGLRCPTALRHRSLKRGSPAAPARPDE